MRTLTISHLKFCWAGLILLGASGVALAGELPSATPLDRYQPMLDKSPFALASQAAPPPVAVDAPGFAKDLILTGIARIGEGEFVSVATRDNTQRFSLLTGESYNGISVASVSWSDAVGKTKVTLKKGSEYGVVSFDEALLAAAAQSKSPGAGPNPPQGNVPPPNAIPGNAGRPPGAQMPRVIRRPKILSPQQ